MRYQLIHLKSSHYRFLIRDTKANKTTYWMTAEEAIWPDSFVCIRHFKLLHPEEAVTAAEADSISDLIKQVPYIFL